MTIKNKYKVRIDGPGISSFMVIKDKNDLDISRLILDRIETVLQELHVSEAPNDRK